MEEFLYTLTQHHLDDVQETERQLALFALESGKVVYFPSYSYSLDGIDTQSLFSETLLNGKRKNMSFDYQSGRLGGINQKNQDPKLMQTMIAFMQGYAQFSKTLVDTLFPQYRALIRWGRTSYRPAQIKGRVSSKRKDDTRLHVDSFSATPVHGFRILRVFCNINPDNEPRVWHLGEPFERVVKQFTPRLPVYNAAIAKLLHWIRVTKTMRSAYDHYQLHLHDAMKLDDEYQRNVEKQRVDFPAHSTWIVFTDQVSHAALSGQYLLEQTFYLPVEAMVQPALAPLTYWETAGV